MITLLQGGWLAAWQGSRHQIVAHGKVALQDSATVYAGLGRLAPGAQADIVCIERGFSDGRK